MPDNFNDCRMKRKALVKKVQVRDSSTMAYSLFPTCSSLIDSFLYIGICFQYIGCKGFINIKTKSYTLTASFVYPFVSALQEFSI